ncbi:hypothetical protein DAPPUDRAFT_331560 [Daphnia pulex]|uniref:Transposase Helix-turn-helix domain-containing protein n=1 Tax=Daphnia pulex TaxID=6669 RepID=E9HMT3_DAPPU|nr:hypothetical protein DAPPUDRAFT_331560 [Daphnia pulex]|eukprot:EFX66950.1 hypothetical protein DAPPUDRAFT_331560 [Daphnia pulex]
MKKLKTEHKRAAAIRFLRKQTKPWSTSQDLDVEMEWEEERHPGFRALLEGIRARNERQEEEGDPEPGNQQPLVEEPQHVRVVREAGEQYALARGEVFQKVHVKLRLNLCLQDLADRLKIANSTASKYVHTWVSGMHQIFVHRPTNFRERVSTFSSYKNHNTIKFLI